MGTRCADHATPLYPQKLALTSPTGGGRSVGIVRSRTKATDRQSGEGVKRTGNNPELQRFPTGNYDVIKYMILKEETAKVTVNTETKIKGKGGGLENKYNHRARGQDLQNLRL